MVINGSIKMKNKKNNNTLICVYGTLRSGFSNHRVMGDSELIGTGKTTEKYKLTASGIPFVSPKEQISNVTVEVYSVTPQQLPRIDGLEGYNPNDHEGSWYKRTPISVTLDNGKEIEASIYFGDREGNTLIETGDYADYRR